MIDKIAAKSGFSLLKWLPAIAAAAFVFGADLKAASAQSIPSTIGYVVTGAGIDTDNGDYYYIGLDYYGNPYYKSAAGVYIFAAGDDQNNRSYYRWYMTSEVDPPINGLFFGGEGGDYETNGVGPDFGGDVVDQGPAIGWTYDFDYYPNPPTVTSM